MNTPLTIATLALTLTACSTTGIKGSGTIQTQDRVVTDFQTIKVHGSGEMWLTQGDVATVQIECDDNLLEHIESKVEHSRLSLGPVGANLRPTKSIIYRVVVKDLDAIALSGSLQLKCEALSANDLSIVTSGSGRIRMGSLNAKTVAYKVSGSGDLQLDSMTADSFALKISGAGKVLVGAGTASILDAEISGSGDLDLTHLQTQEASIRISGSGQARLWVEKKLDARVSGSGNVDYWGSPVAQWSSSGSGKLRNLGERPE